MLRWNGANPGAHFHITFYIENKSEENKLKHFFVTALLFPDERQSDIKRCI